MVVGQSVGGRATCPLACLPSLCSCAAPPPPVHPSIHPSTHACPLRPHPTHPCPCAPAPAGDLKNIQGRVQLVTEDGGVMVTPEDAALPDFRDAIRFEPREVTKYFEVCVCVCVCRRGGGVGGGRWLCGVGREG